ncbi:MAG TPA: hypothetical protein VJL80_14555 [Aeromicrobium sp.]|nr:hypothetical protein [Aeromicrobium sp.]HKY59255.1 hypothetical protein [Aeromicrobium sp.]
MTRVIKARALTNSHLGRLVSWKDLPPARLEGVTTSLRFAYLFFGFGNTPSISADLDDDITIHDEP